MNHRKMAMGVAVVATTAIALPLGASATANAATPHETPYETPASPSARAFGLAVHGTMPSHTGTSRPYAMGEGADAGCDILSGQELAAAYGAQGGPSAATYTSPAQAAVAGAASGATSGAVAGAVTGGAPGAATGAAVGAVAGSVGGAAGAAVNNAVSGASAGGKSANHAAQSPAAFD